MFHTLKSQLFSATLLASGVSFCLFEWGINPLTLLLPFLSLNPLIAFALLIVPFFLLFFTHFKIANHDDFTSVSKKHYLFYGLACLLLAGLYAVFLPLNFLSMSHFGLVYGAATVVLALASVVMRVLWGKLHLGFYSLYALLRLKERYLTWQLASVVSLQSVQRYLIGDTDTCALRDFLPILVCYLYGRGGNRLSNLLHSLQDIQTQHPEKPCLKRFNALLKQGAEKIGFSEQALNERLIKKYELLLNNSFFANRAYTLLCLSHPQGVMDLRSDETSDQSKFFKYVLKQYQIAEKNYETMRDDKPNRERLRTTKREQYVVMLEKDCTEKLKAWDTKNASPNEDIKYPAARSAQEKALQQEIKNCLAQFDLDARQQEQVIVLPTTQLVQSWLLELRRMALADPSNRAREALKGLENPFSKTEEEKTQSKRKKRNRRTTSTTHANGLTTPNSRHLKKNSHPAKCGTKN